MTSRLSRDNAELGSLTVVQLRQELKKRGLHTKGLKKELIERLRGVSLNESHIMDESTVKQRTARKPNGSNGDLDHKQSTMETDLHQRHKAHERERAEREKIVLWKHPFLTLQYFFLESLWLIRVGVTRLWRQKKMVVLVLVAFLMILAMYHTPGSHQKLVSLMKKNCVWWSYWVGLGILSSVGLGTGLHTFVLYLGPHIAAVTLAAYECMSVNFPEPPYPNEIMCPDKEELSISLWTIMSKVRIEAIMWGAGTAIGELPPYFMARAARLSGQDMEDEELEELEELIMERREHPEELSFLERLKLGVHNLVQKVGFFGILACASIPNPLFDLAGITCGHFLVPFWTFFGATLIGKAIIKMHIQKLFVIFIFSEKHVEHVVSLLRYVPKFGPSLQTPFQEWLRQQKTKLHHDSTGTTVESGTNVLSWIFEKVVIIMVVYFLLSIINSMAQSYHKRHSKARQERD